jgi:hypothetical protein
LSSCNHAFEVVLADKSEQSLAISVDVVAVEKAFGWRACVTPTTESRWTLTHQAVVPAKREAQNKVVSMILPKEIGAETRMGA